MNDIDDIFMKAVELTGCNIEQLLNEFFNFLKRRSDFFTINDNGFLPGQAESLVLQSFHKQWRSSDSDDGDNLALSRSPVTPGVRCRVVDDIVPKLSWIDNSSVMTLDLLFNMKLSKDDILIEFGKSYIDLNISKCNYHLTENTLGHIYKSESYWSINYHNTSSIITLHLVKIVPQCWTQPFQQPDLSNQSNTI